MSYYLRKVRVTFNGGALIVNPSNKVEIRDEMKVAFSVSRGIESTQNTAEISVWNLTKGHRNAVGKELDEVQLEAGYAPPSGGGNVGIIFKGQTRDVVHRRDGADIITTISCGDGDKAIRRATLSKSYPRGTKAEDVIEDLYKELEKDGVVRGQWKFPDEMPPFKRPYAVCGSCARELDRLGRGRGFYWSIQSGAMEIIPGDGDLGGNFLIAPPPRGAMVDYPAITDNGVQVSHLLDPGIRPNMRVKIESDVLEMNGEGGEYRVSQATYGGDNRDGDFRVDVHGERVDGGKVDEGKKP